MAEEAPRELIFDGFGVSPGIGMGIAYVRERGLHEVPEYRIAAEEVPAERRRLKSAASSARRQVARLQLKLRGKASKISGAAAEEIGYLLDAYFHMLKDSRLVRGADLRILSDHINAEAAVQAEINAITMGFEAMQDAYLAARSDDIREVGCRLLQHLIKKAESTSLSIPKGGVVITDELTAADAAQLDPMKVVGIAAMSGGRQSHTAIMARALGIPAVLGVPGLIGAVKTGDRIFVDGDLGRVVVNPMLNTVTAFRHRRSERLRDKRRLTRLAKRPAITRDGIEIHLQANVELPMEMQAVSDVGALGIGLLRSEFLFINRPSPPSEDEQYELLRDIVERAQGHPVTIRTPDFGGEVRIEALTGEFGQSGTSLLGMRGIRLSLARPELLETQFRAILRVGAHGPVRILLPLVTTIAEVRAAREILARAARKLHRRGAAFPIALPPLGTMIEVPAAALTADALAQVSDFFAIGSNDLTMYTLAIDRGDQWVAHLYDPLHPAVLRLIQFAAAAALRSRIPASVCGEMAGDPRMTGLLLGLGFRELSMTSASIPGVKRQILDLEVGAAAYRAQQIMEQTDPVRIQALLEEFHGAC
jgi:phosphoenolpyruvate-protein phosphotransferase (PTS system enzyme I)